MGEPPTSGRIESVSTESRTSPPPRDFAHRARVPSLEEYHAMYAASVKNPEAFWAKAAEELHWFRRWDRVFDGSQAPFTKWFVGGRTNLSFNCLDRHLATPRRNKAAIVWEGEPGDERVLTYADLAREVSRFANGLKKLGVARGDRVAIYLPMIPELVTAVLACARIGAVHTVIFAGFSAESIRDRVNDCGARVIVTSDGGWRRGKVLGLKSIVDEAISQASGGCPTVAHVVVAKRGHGDPFPCHIHEGRDHWWHRLVEELPLPCPAEEMDSEDPLFLLYTSGTTGKPKGILHTTAGYGLYAHMTTKYVFDLRDEDLFWCTADIGWVTGHSYVVYGPLSCGATVFLYEGAPDWPHADRFWEMIEKYRVSIFYTAPTAIRAFMKWGDRWPDARDLSSLRLLGTVGEPINPEAWIWYHERIGGGKCPIVDTWWQTETGGVLITPLPGAIATKPGSATLPFFGIEPLILDEKGNETDAGYLAIRRPWPGIMRGIWGDPDRYRTTYWSKWPIGTAGAPGPVYFPGDGARRDKDGYFWILGRVDDVVNVAGHRIGTAELESAFVEHPAVAEAAVVGVAHDLKGQAMIAFVSLRAGHAPTAEIEKELVAWVEKKIGAFARPERVILSGDLPKTRSGKIMRRLLRDIAEGRVLGNVTTLADSSVIEALKTKYEGEEG